MAAAQNGRQAQADAVQLLMRRGADPSIKNLENEQPIQLVPEGPVGDQVSIRFKPGSSAVTKYSDNGIFACTDFPWSLFIGVLIAIIYRDHFLMSFVLLCFFQVRRVLKGRGPQVRSCLL